MSKRSGRSFQLLVDIRIVDGCFTSIEDLMQYLKYRLNLSSRDSKNIELADIKLIAERNVQMEIDL